MKTRKLLAFFLVLCLAITPLTVYAGDSTAVDSEERTFIVAIPSLPQTFNFYKQITGYESYVLANMYSTLILKDENGDYQPCIAEKWEISEDAKAFTFYIDKNAKFEDGTPITSEDVAFSIEQLAASDCSSYIYDPLVASIDTPDEYTITINLKKPSVSFIEYLCQAYYGIISSKAAYEKYGDDYGSSVDTVLSSGAYRLVEWKTGESITMEANENYWGEKSNIKRVKFVKMDDSNTAMNALQTGEIDTFWNDVPGIKYPEIQADQNISMYEFPSLILYAVFFNNETGLFTDINLRKAVALAIDKPGFITVGSEGYGTEADYIGDRGGSNETGDPGIHGVWNEYYAQDIEAAKKLVDDNGYTGTKVTIKTFSYEPFPTFAAWLQNTLLQIGLEADIELIERATFLTNVEGKGEYEIMICRWVCGTEDMDEVIYGSLHSDSYGSPGNWAFYKPDPAYDEAITDAAGITDPEERKAAYEAIIRQFLEECVYIPVYYPVSSRAYRNDVTVKDGLQKYDRVFYYNWAE